MKTLWRIVSKTVDFWDRTADRDRRQIREIPLLLVVVAIIIGATLASIAIDRLAGDTAPIWNSGQQP